MVYSVFRGFNQTGVSRFLIMLSVAVFWFSSSAFAASQEATEITLLYGKHLHGEFGDDGLSFAHHAALANRIRSSKPNAFYMGSGDDLAVSLLSSLFQGKHMVAALNAAGLDFDTYGNHEFTSGSENLLERVSESEFTWVSANVIDRRTGNVFGAGQGAARYAIVDVGGVRVGITGIAPADTAMLANTGEDVAILDPADALASLVPEMRNVASIIVVLSHESWRETRRIAAAVPGVDVYIGDHTGPALTEPEVIGGAILSRAGDGLNYLGELTLTIEGGAIVDRAFALHDVRALVEAGALYPDARVQRVIDAYDRLAAVSMEERVGYSRTPLDARVAQVRTGESGLGNFVADALRNWADADVAIQNGGSLRGDTVYGPGALTRGDVISILPFANYGVKLRLQGKTIVQALEHGVSLAEYGHGMFPQVSGLTFAYDLSQPAGERIATVQVGDRAIDPDAWYTLATNDFLAGGGDGYTMLGDAERLIPAEAGELVSSIVIRAIQNRGEIAPEVEGRIISLSSR